MGRGNYLSVKTRQQTGFVRNHDINQRIAVAAKSPLLVNAATEPRGGRRKLRGDSAATALPKASAQTAANATGSDNRRSRTGGRPMAYRVQQPIAQTNVANYQDTATRENSACSGITEARPTKPELCRPRQRTQPIHPTSTVCN